LIAHARDANAKRVTDKPPTRADILAFLEQQHEHTVLHTLGIEHIVTDDDRVIVEAAIDERLYQHAGIVHGGVYVLLAESAASGAAAFAVDVTKFRIAGQEISASHVRSATSGRLRAEAKLVHRGKTSLVYTIDVENDGKLVSTCRCTIAVRPL
jgi:uncharacterized protein (TIGR00369 family)